MHIKQNTLFKSTINLCTEAKIILLICKGRLLIPYTAKLVSIMTKSSIHNW